jgi:hypothetical protein
LAHVDVEKDRIQPRQSELSKPLTIERYSVGQQEAQQSSLPDHFYDFHQLRMKSWFSPGEGDGVELPEPAPVVQVCGDFLQAFRPPSVGAKTGRTTDVAGIGDLQHQIGCRGVVPRHPKHKILPKITNINQNVVIQRRSGTPVVAFLTTTNIKMP